LEIGIEVDLIISSSLGMVRGKGFSVGAVVKIALVGN